MRLLKWTFKGLVLLLIIVVVAVGILLGSADGIAWLVRTADQAIPGELRVEQVSGGLFGDLRLDGFHYSDPAMRVELASLVLRWQPRALLQRRLHILQLSVGDGRFEQLRPSPDPEPEPEPSEPFSLPDIDLPLAIALDRVSIDNFVVVTTAADDRQATEPGADAGADSVGGTQTATGTGGEVEPAAPLVLEKLLLRANAKGTEVTLETLEVRVRDLVEAKLGATVQTAGAWPLHMRDTLALSLPDLPRFEVAGGISGDLRRLSLQQTVSGGVDADLNAAVRDPLGTLLWQTRLSLKALSDEVAALAGIELPPTLHAELTGDGDLQQASVDLDLQLGTPAAMADDDVVAEIADPAIAATADPKSAGDATRDGRQPAQPPEQPPAQQAARAPAKLGPRSSFVKLKATVQFDALEFDARGQWQELQWPLVGSPQVVSESGGLELKGSADDYRFQLNAQVDGPEIPPGAWSANGSGSTEQVTLEALQADILGGQLKANARAAWAPRLDWQAALSGDAINPGHLATDWPGSLGFALSSTGTIDGDERHIGVVIERIDGQLRDLPLDGRGEFQMDGAAMQFKGIRLSSGRATIRADGGLQDQWKLDWGIDVADLAELLPDGQGRFEAIGKLSGDAELPNVSAKLAADGILFQDLALQRLEGDVDLRLSPASGGQVANIRLNGQQLGTAGNLLDKLVLKIAGPFDRQTLHLSAEHPLAAVALDAAGALDLEALQWQGKLTRLDLDGREWRKWGLKAPVTVAASAEAVKTSELCLREGGTALCAEADWKPGAGTARASLKGLSFERLKPLLPEGLTELTGGVDADVNAVLGPVLTAKADIGLKPGVITYLVDETTQVRLNYQGGGFKATYDKQAVAADLKLNMEDSGIDAQLRIPRAALDKDPLSAPLDGKLNFDFKQLGLVTAFAPVIEKSEGLISGRLKLGGVLGAPKIGGKVNLDMAALVIPDAGLDLNDLKLALTGEGTRLNLSGGVSSGPGKLEFGGNADLDAAKGWPASLTLKGDHFQAVSLPEASVMISPDIQVDHGEQGLKIRGQVLVPEAAIRLRELPSGSRSVSSDVVIVDSNTSDEELQSGLPIDAQVTIRLGKKVDFHGFGLTADLGGQLTVTQKPGELPVGNGELGIERGSFRSFGQALDIDRGKVFYAGGSLTNPGLNIRASRPVDDLTVGVLVTGTAKRPVIKVFSSDPTMKENDARSLLLTGTTQDSGDSASVYAGTNLTDKLSVGTNVSVDGKEKEFVARYKFNKKWSVRTTSSSTASGGELLYTIEFK